jgi:hypothetical protein
MSSYRMARALTTAGQRWLVLVVSEIRSRKTVLEGLEKESREAKKGLWIEPVDVPPWAWRKRKSREWVGLLVGVGALGVSLRRSQRDTDCRAKIKFLPLNYNHFPTRGPCAFLHLTPTIPSLRGAHAVHASSLPTLPRVLFRDLPRRSIARSAHATQYLSWAESIMFSNLLDAAFQLFPSSPFYRYFHLITAVQCSFSN